MTDVMARLIEAAQNGAVHPAVADALVELDQRTTALELTPDVVADDSPTQE